MVVFRIAYILCYSNTTRYINIYTSLSINSLFNEREIDCNISNKTILSASHRATKARKKRGKFKILQNKTKGNELTIVTRSETFSILLEQWPLLFIPPSRNNRDPNNDISSFIYMAIANKNEIGCEISSRSTMHFSFPWDIHARVYAH